MTQLISIFDRFRKEELSPGEKDNLYQEAEPLLEGLTTSAIPDLILLLLDDALWEFQDDIALKLMQLQAHEAVPTLMQAIHAPRNKHYRAKLLKSVAGLDAADYFMDFIALVCASDAGWEVSQNIKKYAHLASDADRVSAEAILNEYYAFYKKQDDSMTDFSKNTNEDVLERMVRIRDTKRILIESRAGEIIQKKGLFKNNRPPLTDITALTALPIIVNRFRTENISEEQKTKLYFEALPQIENCTFEAIPDLIHWLSDEHLWDLQNPIAMQLQELRAHDAVPAIMAAIRNPRNIIHNGTLIWSLAKLDAVDYFMDIIELTCVAVSYEAQLMARGLIVKYMRKITTTEKAKAIVLLYEYHAEYKKQEDAQPDFQENTDTKLLSRMILIRQAIQVLKLNKNNRRANKLALKETL